MDGDINFTSPTGPFAVPIKCLTKKCVVSLDKKEIDFGVVYLGETVRQSVTVYNAGALSTQYTIITHLPTLKQTEDTPPHPAVPSVTATPQPDIPLPTLLALQQAQHLADRSNYSIMTTVETFPEPDTSTGLGVIPHRLKSKSTGEIFMSQTSNEQDTPNVQDTKTQNQDTSPKAKEKPRPKSRDKSRPGSRKSRDTPTPKSQDTPSDSHAGKSRDTSTKSRPKSRDTGSMSAADSRTKGRVPSDTQATPNILLQNTSQSENQDTPGNQDTPQPESQDTPQRDILHPMIQDTQQVDAMMGDNVVPGQ